jgi:hypothetical protein
MLCLSDIESYICSSKPSRYYNFIFYLYVIICTEFVLLVALMLVTLSYS